MTLYIKLGRLMATTIMPLFTTQWQNLGIEEPCSRCGLCGGYKKC